MKRAHLRFFKPIFFSLLIPFTTCFVLSEQEAVLAPVQVAVTVDTSTLKIPAALSAAGFVKFAAAVQAAGLSATLEEEGPFTCFAPTDKAFDAMPEEIKKLLKESPKSEKAKEWIMYHFIKSEIAVKRKNLEETGALANSLGDKPRVIWVTTGKISVNRICEITRFDIVALNGIIHELNRVLDADDE